MRTGCFIGRVGGLAVALGVGVAVACGPPVASAEDGSAASTSPSSTDAGGSPGADSAKPPEPHRTRTIGSTAKSADAGTDADTDSETEEISAPRSGSAVTDESDTIAPGGERVPRPPKRDGVSMERNIETPAATTEAQDGTGGGGQSNQRSGGVPARAPRLPHSVEDAAPAAASRSKLSEPARAVVTAVDQPATPQPATARTYASIKPDVAPPAASAADTVPTQAGSAVSSIVSAALATVGLGPLATDSPLTPVESPLRLALAAWGTRPRPSGQPMVDETRILTAVTTLTGQESGTDKSFAAAATPSATPIHLENQPSITVGANPSAVAVSPDGQRLYVANTGSNTVSVINTTSGRKIDANPRSIFSTNISVGTSPGALALSPGGTRLYVANTGRGTVSVINTDTWARVDANRSIFSRDIEVGASPSAMALSADGARLYVANRGDNTVSVINTGTNTVIDTNPTAPGTQSISVGSAPGALTLDPDGRLYVANGGAGTVSVINTSGYGVAETFRVGSRPAGMTLGSDGRLYVANTGGDSVSVIDTYANHPGTQSISVGREPTSVALSPEGDLAYVVHGNDTVSVISTEDYTVLSTVAIDSDVSGGHVVAVAPSGTVYVTDATDRAVRVLAPSAASTPATTLTLLGNSVTVTGDVTPRPLVAADGTRAVIVTPVTSATSRTTRVAVIDIATGRQVGNTLTLTGGAPSTVLSSDGTRASVTTTDATNSTRVTVIDTATGTLVGNTVSVAGSTGDTQLWSTSPSRYQVITEAGPETQSTRVTVVDTRTDTETGSVLIPGELMTAQQLGVDGSRVLVTTQSFVSIYDSTTAVTRAMVIDAPSGTQLGTTLELTGFPGELSVSANGNHALIASQVSLPYDWNVLTTYVAMLDTTTGTQTGTTISGSGASGVTARFSPDSSRALFTSYDSDTEKTTVAVVNTGTGAEVAVPITIEGQTTDVFMSPAGLRTAIVTTRAVAVVNVLTGVQTGSTQRLAGQTSGGSYFSQFTGDGSRLVLATVVYNMSGGMSDTRIAILNMTDGTLMGSPTILPGGVSTGAPLLTVDDTRVLVVTDAFDGQNRTYLTQVAVFDTATGNQVGNTLTLAGRVLFQPRTLSENGTHVVMAYPTRSILGSTTYLAVVDTLTGAQTASISVPGEISGDLVMTPDGKYLLLTTTTAATLTSRTTRLSVLAIS
ncbi:hypothetical protein CYL16_16305 [Mycobacterium sp. EPG1]|nr:hypothetical protein CYL16_16305 [Mycobacterium sp. EPG1]